MPRTEFTLDWMSVGIAAIFLALFFLAWRWSLRYPSPLWRFSHLPSLQTTSTGWRTKFHRLPNYCLYGSLACFLLAFIDPHFVVPKREPGRWPKPPPLEGIGIYLVLDQSGSMEQQNRVLQADGSTKTMSRLDLLKAVTTDFVNARPQDLIGMITFARGAYIESPLTLDHQAILDKLKRLDIMRVKDQDGTSIGYAIYKAATIISATRHYAETLQGEEKPAYEIKSNIIILVTDGIQEPNPLDKGKRLRNLNIPEAAAYAREQGVRVYIVNLEPRLSQKEFAPFLNQMTQAAESTGGKFFLLQGTTSLSDIYASIDQLEKSRLPGLEEYDMLESLPKEKQPYQYTVFSLYPFLIALGLFLLFISFLLNTTLMRRAP